MSAKLQDVESRRMQVKANLQSYMLNKSMDDTMHPEGKQKPANGRVVVEVLVAGVWPSACRQRVEELVRFRAITDDPEAVFGAIKKL